MRLRAVAVLEVRVMAMVLMAGLILAICVLGFLFGSDSRDGVDGSGALGRRAHRGSAWW